MHFSPDEFLVIAFIHTFVMICVECSSVVQFFLSPASSGRIFEHLWNIFLQHVSYVSDEKSIYNELVGVLVVALHMPS